MRDFGEIVKDKGIPWVRHWIDATFEFSKNFVKSGTSEIDFEALGREEWEFRKALKTKDFSKNERAKYLWNEALNIHNRNANNGKKSPGRPKKIPQDAPNGNAGVDMSDTRNGAASKSPTSCDTLTADGDIREGADGETDGNVATARTTVSRNMRRVPQTEAPAHGFSGGRTAQGTMSRSPEAAAQSGKDSAKTRDTRDDSRGRYAPPSCSPEDGIPAETAPSHGGSVASLEARQVQARESRRTGGSSVRGMAKVAQPSVRSRASFRNKEDFIQWAIDDGLDPVDAGECWEATEERGGKDADGNTVKNMKAFARQWCRTRANNRRTA